jgi:hypothetical protein
MKTEAIVRGGILGGILVAAVITIVGTLLEIDLPPWSWSVITPDALSRTIEWTRRFLILLPFSILYGIVIAVACALLFEYVTARAGSIAGAMTGLAVGALTATVLSLIPWITFWCSFTYMPTISPLGPYNSSWLWVTLLTTGALAGLTAGAMYGQLLHTPRSSRRSGYREIYPSSRIM